MEEGGGERSKDTMTMWGTKMLCVVWIFSAEKRRREKIVDCSEVKWSEAKWDEMTQMIWFDPESDMKEQYYNYRNTNQTKSNQIKSNQTIVEVIRWEQNVIK